jgi:ABC-2 type transport system permease protein
MITEVSTVDERGLLADLFAAEWIKLWSLRSTRLGLVACAVIVLAITVNTSVADVGNWPAYGPGIKQLFVPIWSMRDAFNDPAGMVLAMAASGIGAVTVVGEYSSGMIRTTFAAVPARRAVMGAKVAVVAVVFTVFGAVLSAASFGISQAILSAEHIGLSIGYPGALRAVAASALLAPVCALIGMGVGAVIRHTATTIVVVTGFLLLVPRLFDSRRHHWVAVMHDALPASAWARLTETGAETVLGEQAYPASIAGSWTAFALWSLAAAVVTVVAVHRRDL